MHLRAGVTQAIATTRERSSEMDGRSMLRASVTDPTSTLLPPYCSRTAYSSPSMRAERSQTPPSTTA